jgi:hypothetical protein
MPLNTSEITEQVTARAGSRPRADQLDDIALHCSGLTVFDDRNGDEIMDHDQTGLPRQGTPN